MAEGVAASWRALRTQVLDDAVQVHLLPMLETEARRLLKQRAEEGVLREAGRALRRAQALHRFRQARQRPEHLPTRAPATAAAAVMGLARTPD